MNKFLPVLVFVAVLFYGFSAFAEPSFEATYNILGISIAQRDMPKRGPELIALMRKGLDRESINAFAPAMQAYDQCLTIAQSSINSGNFNKQTIDYILPYSIGTTYRKSIITNKSIDGSVVSLYKQLQMYEDVDKWINEVLTSTSNFKLEHDTGIQDTQIAPLFFARAYNRMAWAYSLMSGNTWKRYIVYPPSSIAAMVVKSINDLKQDLAYYGISPNDSADDVSKKVDIYFSKAIPFGEDLTLRIVLKSKSNDSSKEKIKSLFNNIKKVIALYYSPNISDSIYRGKDIRVFEDILKPEAKEMLNSIGELVSQMEALDL